MGDKRVPVLFEVLSERKRQDRRWGEQNHRPADYYAILAEEVGEAAKEVVEATFPRAPSSEEDHLAKLRVELIQSAAVAVAMVECLDRNVSPRVATARLGRMVSEGARCGWAELVVGREACQRDAENLRLSNEVYGDSNAD